MSVDEEPVIKISSEEPVLETLFDPMDQVETLDPEYEKKQQEEAGLDLKNAINDIRDNVEELQTIGFKINSEELDLDDKYQIIITIDK